MTTPGVVLATQDVLEQGLALLSSVDDLLYCTKADEPFSASVGGHYRHVLDHFLCLAAGMASGSVDYDQRGRSRELETNRGQAERMTQLLIQSFRTLSGSRLEESCEVVYTVAYSVDGPEQIQSTFARELAFCVSHAVHHFAIIRLICSHLSVPTNADLGIAPSTLQYRREQAAN